MKGSTAAGKHERLDANLVIGNDKVSNISYLDYIESRQEMWNIYMNNLHIYLLYFKGIYIYKEQFMITSLKM